jgi:hypothetical protein
VSGELVPAPTVWAGCSASRDGGSTTCGQPAVAHVRYLCEHEHMADGFGCLYHTRRWTRNRDKLVCDACQTLGSPWHRCQIRAVLLDSRCECGYHHARGSCCDPDDCGPCCEDCPTCPTLAGARASLWDDVRPPAARAPVVGVGYA